MTSERLSLVWHSIALLLLFAGLGSGPAVWLIRDRRFQFAMMPVLGFALAASLLTTSMSFLTMATATWAVLVPAAVVSVGVAVVLTLRRSAGGPSPEIAIPAVVLVLGAALALAPPFAHGTQGPYAYMIDDSWGYAATALFLQQHKVGDQLPPETATPNFTVAYGAAHLTGGARAGVDAVDASGATLLHTDTGSALTPFLAVLFGLVPVVIWLVVRGLGGSWYAATVGGLLGLTPAILTMVVDTTLGNLAGEVLAIPALFFLARSIVGESGMVDAVVAGVLLTGLAAAYPEFLVPSIAALVCAAAVFGIVRLRQKRLRETLQLGTRTGGLVIVTMAIVGPDASYRAIEYIFSRRGDGLWAGTLPTRGLTVENVGSWAFGLHHLYEMPFISSYSAVHLVFAVYFPVVLAIVTLIGLVRLRFAGVFVAIPMAVAAILGIYAYYSYQAGHCEYCLWKALTFMIPFLVAGLALGIEHLWRAAGSRRTIYLQRGLTGIVAIVAIAAVGNSDRKLVKVTRLNGAFYTSELHDLGKTLGSLPTRKPILIEGVGSMGQSQFAVPAAYFAVQGHKEPVLIDAGSPPRGLDYLGLYPQTSDAYYSPDYGYVLTPYEDVRSDRTVIERLGSLTLEKRAPIDVVVSPSGSAVDGTTPRIPWVSAPFVLRFASDNAVDAAVRISLDRPPGGRSTLTFAEGDRQLETVVSSGSEVCVNVSLRKGSTTIEATPWLDPLAPPASWQLQKELGLAAITAAPGRCQPGPSVQPVSFGDGWFPTESYADGTHFRWMGSVATIELGANGEPRPALEFDARATSFAHPRKVTVVLGDRKLASVCVPAGRSGAFEIAVPPGRGVASLYLFASPAAESASTAVPGDTRLLSIAVSHVSVRTRGGAQR